MSYLVLLNSFELFMNKLVVVLKPSFDHFTPKWGTCKYPLLHDQLCINIHQTLELFHLQVVK